MRINAASVAFRHLTVSAADLARYTLREGFDGLEIWAPHARAMARDWAALTQRPAVPMLAGYLPLGQAGFCRAEAQELVDLTGLWGAHKLRLFAGHLGSHEAGTDQHQAILGDLETVADMALSAGIGIAVETHPGTLADSLPATAALLETMNHRAIGINFDVLHVWESGADPQIALTRLGPFIVHFHLKTVTARTRLGVFAPANIHDPDGCRDGICPLFEGALDYARLLDALPPQADATLEWFGPKPAATMIADLRAIRAHLSGTQAPQRCA